MKDWWRMVQRWMIHWWKKDAWLIKDGSNMDEKGWKIDKNALNLHERCMKDGWNMDERWMKDGWKMDERWTKDGSNMDERWMKDG